MREPGETTASGPAQPPRRRRSDGERSRTAILGEAARLATVDGIAGLSIGGLAAAVGMSKSGLFAHFGSKEELQLATVEWASALFDDHVLRPASRAERGMARLRVLTEGYLAYATGDLFPGGCFFASILTEMDMHPGPVRDRAVRFLEDWLAELEKAVREAQAAGEIDAAEDPGQLVFEVEAFLFTANAQFVATRDRLAIDRARRAIDARLAVAAPRGQGG